MTEVCFEKTSNQSFEAEQIQLGSIEGRNLKIGKRKSVKTTTMDNSESNIDFTQILAALQHLQQENAVLKDLVTRL
jgi:hypothetical protein